MDLNLNSEQSQHYKKLKWRCRRGMKELDILLSCYITNYYNNANKEEQQNFEDLLDIQDPELYSLFTGRELLKNTDMQLLVDKISKLKSY